MAAVTSAASGYSPPPTRGAGRRRWVWLVVAAWIVVVGVLAVWSVKHSPATVPEQRTIQQALPDLQAAAGVVYAAADGPGRAVVLGDLKVVQDCRITPVRSGVIATRDVTVYVRDGEGRTDLQAIAAGLPASYKPKVITVQGDTEFGLHADAGNFIGIDSDANAGDPQLTLQVSSGCRPLGSGGINRSDPAPGSAPSALSVALTALGAPSSGAVATQTVACPQGKSGGTFTLSGLAGAAKPGEALKGLMAGGASVRADTRRWAYRAGDDSVVVTQDDEGRLQVAASSAC